MCLCACVGVCSARKWGRFYHIHTLKFKCIMRNGEDVNGTNRQNGNENGKWYYLLMLSSSSSLHFWLFVYLKSTLSLYALSICSHFHAMRWSKTLACVRVCVCCATLCATILSPSIFIVTSLLVFLLFSLLNSFACLPVWLQSYDIFAKTSNHFRKFASYIW